MYMYSTRLVPCGKCFNDTATKVFTSGSQVGEGLSEKALWAFFIAHVTRLSTTFWGEA